MKLLFNCRVDGRQHCGRAGLNYHNSGTFEGLRAAGGTRPSWEFMIRPIICPNPVCGCGSELLVGAPTKLGSPQGGGERTIIGPESSNRSFSALDSIDLGWVQPFLKAIKSGRCSLDQTQDGGDGS